MKQVPILFDEDYIKKLNLIKKERTVKNGRETIFDYAEIKTSDNVHYTKDKEILNINRSRDYFINIYTIEGWKYLNKYHIQEITPHYREIPKTKQETYYLDKDGDEVIIGLDYSVTKIKNV